MSKRIISFFTILMCTIIFISTGCKNDEISQVPEVITFQLSDIEQQSATCGGFVSSSSPIISRGICWSNHVDPTILDSSNVEGNGEGSFSSYIQNLIPDTIYYVRAFATNETGTGYGSTMFFKTKKATLQVTTLPLSEILLSSATGGAVVNADNGTTIIARGLCWSTLPIPTILDNKINSGQGEGSFSATITELMPNSTYYVRAFASTDNSTIYGSVIAFKTRGIAINVTTLSINNITQNTASCMGIVNCELESSISSRGVCWSTNPNPTINDNKKSEGVGNGSFSCLLENLTANTNYFARAYATNFEGTAYGSTVTFKSAPGTPIMSTLSVYNLTNDSAKCDAKIISNNGSDIITYGVCFGLKHNPTIEDNKISLSNVISDNYTVNLFPLKALTTYFARSYAINAIGISYGNELQFAQNDIVTFNESLSYGSVSDNEGNIYKTIVIGTQTWMAQNLRATKFRNGDVIPTTATIQQDITNETAPLYFWEIKNPKIYGLFYTGFVATDSRNICPVGWHIPSDSEWTILMNYLGYNVAADKLRETGTLHWGTSYNNGLATNSTGFTAISTGNRIPISFPYENGCVWWTSTSTVSGSNYSRQIIGTLSIVSLINNNKKVACSIRCIKD